MKTITGACGCGSVVFEATGEIEGVISCHCKFCQRLHGIYNPMVMVDKTAFSFTKEDGLEWYKSSEDARRGFCKICGSALFKEQTTGPKMLIAVGSLDDTSGWKNVKNVFSEEAGGYYRMPEES